MRLSIDVALRQLRNTVISFGMAVIATGALAGCSQSTKQAGDHQTTPLRVAIAPYQELALLVNEKPLGLEKKYGTKIEILTMPWEELLPAVASAGQTIDVGFASLPDYMAKAENLNKNTDDPVLYLFPAWIFRGGGFVAFKNAVPQLNKETIKDPTLVKRFFGFRLGVQKNSCGHMLLWKLAHGVDLKFSQLPIIDSTLNDGLLAAENGSLDAAAAGLTQRTEALKRHGRVVLTMDDMGAVDPGGFVCKQSVYRNRKKDVEALIRMWFDCADYVLSDLDHHSDTTLAYLKANASTQYTLEEFKRALSPEYVPKSVEEAQKEIVSGQGKYSIADIAALCNDYLLDIGATKKPVPLPKIITLAQDSKLQ